MLSFGMGVPPKKVIRRINETARVLCVCGVNTWAIFFNDEKMVVNQHLGMSFEPPT